MILRNLIMMVPKWVLPTLQHYGGVMVVDPHTKEYVDLIQDPTGKDIGALTGVTVHDNKLYLGSLENDFVGVYDLS